MDIKDVDINALLAALAQRVAPDGHIVDRWMKAQGYFPGSTRVRSRDLYRRFKAWCQQHAVNRAEMLSHKTFGAALSTRLKRGRTANYAFYYVSRERQFVSATLEKDGGLGNLGGSTPGGEED